MILIEYSVANFRDKLSNETLSLRKNRHKQELFSRRGILIDDRERHQICPMKLKKIPEIIQDKFRINPENVDSIKRTMEYLNSQELDEIKFGSFLLRRFFCELAEADTKLNKENKILDFKIDKFLENNLTQSIAKVLTTESNIDILSELTWALVNITYFEAEKGKYEYIKEFMNQTYMNIFYKLVKLGDNEILTNLYDFLVNCVLDNDEFANFIFAEQDFIRLCIMKYLEQTKLLPIEQEAKQAAIFFFISLSKLSNIFNEKQKNTFFKIYEKFLGVNFDSLVLMHVIVGIRFLFEYDKSKEKVIFNLIKKNNYDIFDKLFITFNNMYKENPSFSGLGTVIYNIKIIISLFIQLSEEKDIIYLVRNTQLINFFDYFFKTLFFKTNQMFLLDIIVQLSHHTSNVVLNMVQDREDFLETIKNNLNSNHFDFKMKFVDIVYSMLSLLSLDINIILYNNEIISHLIQVNLPFEEEKTCLKYVLSSILFFINSIKPLDNNLKVEIINNFIKLGISNGFDNMPNRFNEEHILIINQIKTEIQNILNNENKTQENSEKSLNSNNSNNPFLIFNKSIEENNGIVEEKKNENQPNNKTDFIFN